MDFKGYIFTGNRLDCTGCGACVQTCSHKALSMEEDKDGFLFPVIDNSKCTKCGLCESVCPIVTKKMYNNQLQTYFVLTSKSVEESKKSATIGLCSILSKYVINGGGVVYGCMLDEKEWKARHVRLVAVDDIDIIRNSKYLQSDTKDTFSLVKKDLVDGYKVLYIGTPCEIAGLKSFLRKDYEKLMTIDIICHGVFSPKLIKKEIAYWRKRIGAPVRNFKFRSKRKYPWTYGGVVNFDYIDKKNNLKHKEFHGSCSPTYRCFAYSGDGLSYNLREACYACQFRNISRYGDLTVGDAWGLENELKNIFSSYNQRQGISLVLCNSVKGRKLFENVKYAVNVFNISKESALKNTALLPCSRDIPALRVLIYENLDNMDYGCLISKILKIDFNQIETQFHHRFIKDKIKHFIKAILLNNKL